MGRGDNRRTHKMKQRKAHNAKKARLARRIEEGKTAKKEGGARRSSATDASAATVRRPGDQG